MNGKRIFVGRIRWKYLAKVGRIKVIRLGGEVETKGEERQSRG